MSFKKPEHLCIDCKFCIFDPINRNGTSEYSQSQYELKSALKNIANYRCRAPQFKDRSSCQDPILGTDCFISKNGFYHNNQYP